MQHLRRLVFFPKQLLSEMDRCDSALVPNNKLPGFEISAYSSLGQGLSIAIGIAFGLKIKQNRHNHVYCIIGDGELDEGQVWESIFTALHYNLSQLVIIFNINGYQNDGKTIDIKNIPIQKVVTSLNINSIEIDGHNHSSIRIGLKSIINKEGPKVVICKTIKGKGISFIEQNPIKYHACRLSKEEYDQAMSELNNSS